MNDDLGALPDDGPDRFAPFTQKVHSKRSQALSPVLPNPTVNGLFSVKNGPCRAF